jgi:ABC transporter substrate binding protein (PQQ-dependent alcohol dehydrogenase system)
MIARALVFLATLATLAIAGSFPATAQSDQPRDVRIAYLTRVDDPFYAGSGGYTGIYGAGREPAVAAAAMAIKEARLIGRAAGLRFSIAATELQDGEVAAAILERMAEQEGVVAAILDLPEDEVREAALALAESGFVLFNSRHRGMDLRVQTCNTGLLHVMASEAMLADGLVQHLLALGWRDILEIHGETDEDRAIAAAFEASARKYGLTITDTRMFAAGNDPRRREESNIKLMLASSSAEVVFIADASREFARFVPYNTPRPALIVGSAGLVPSAWSFLWERHGAPQLNKRFLKAAGRPMLDGDWASWVAVRAVVEALRLAPALDKGGLAKALLDSGLRLELYKGYPGSFRSWDGQLRQPVLLATGEAVVGMAPVEGVLHETSILDTLGLDDPEFTCAR